jgi:myo-inositol 2-dehydrogenase/D-chiro-inositol 1-dehydrogenase
MKKVKYGIIGIGTLGMQRARDIQFRIPNAELVAICSRDEDKLHKLQAELEVPRGYTDYNELLHDPELDAVVIASATAAHYKHVVAAIDAGLHIFLEKPTGMNEEECLAIENKAAESDKLFTVGFMRRYDPSYAAAKKRIDNGEIGTPILYRGYSLDPVWIADYMAERAENNGCWFLDMGVHDYDLARWFLGSEPVSVYACGGAYKYPVFAKSNDVDNGYALMSFENGSAAFFYEGRTAPHGSHVETEIVGTDGTIRINGIPARDRSITYSSNGVSTGCVANYQERWTEAFYLELQAFTDAVQQGLDSVGANAHDGTRATIMGTLAQESYQSGELKKF